VLSWRRAGGDRRQQLKWLMSGSAIAVACVVIGNVVPALDSVATQVGVGVVLPACLGVAILKYRLYAIDRLISRTMPAASSWSRRPPAGRVPPGLSHRAVRRG
jgi:hypothetical protein